MAQRCFDPTLYHYSISDPFDRQCISPTQTKPRCSFRFRESELVEINDLTSEAEALSDNEDRDEVLQRLVLLRTCGNVHRMKVEANPACVREVARHYGRLISSSRLGSRRSSTTPRRGSTPSEPEYWSDKGKLRPYHQLRPRNTQGRAVTNLSQTGPAFVPYRRYDAVKEILSGSVPFDYVSYGHVYAYTWPEHPGYVKIGYTQNLRARLSDWSACMPGLKLVTSVAVPFPKRMEEIIHLQMNSVRYMIQRCRSCDKLHFEWFKATTEEVVKILDGWKDVVTRQPLYDSARRLTDAWRGRISGVQTEMTAHELLVILDREEALAKFQAELARLLKETLAQEAEMLAKAREREIARAKEEAIARAKEEEVARAKEEIAKAKEKQIAEAREAGLARIKESKIAKEKKEKLARIEDKRRARAKKIEHGPIEWDRVLDIFGDFMASLSLPETTVVPVAQVLPAATSLGLRSGVSVVAS